MRAKFSATRYNIAMTTIADRIAKRLKVIGISERSASLKATGSPNTIRNIRLGDSKNPRSDTIHKLSIALECSPEWLLTGHKSPEDVSKSTPVQTDDSYTVPVLGTAMGSLIAASGSISDFEGFTIDNEPKEYVRLPHGLTGQKNIYAFFVTGDSMDPMHPHGQIRFAQPNRPPVPGDTVVVQTKHWEHDPGQAYIKVLRKRTGSMLVLEQINPLATLQIPNKFVVALHRVASPNDLI